MSSQRPEPVGEPAATRPRWYSYWPKWRRVMMTGAVILLVGSLLPTIMGRDDAPAGVTNASFIIGYVLLAYGFFLAMRSRRAPDAQQPTGETPPGRSDNEERAEVLEEET